MAGKFKTGNGALLCTSSLVKTLMPCCVFNLCFLMVGNWMSFYVVACHLYILLLTEMFLYDFCPMSSRTDWCFYHRALRVFYIFYISSVQSLSHVRLFETPWTAARQASLSITNSQSSPKPMSIELVMPSSHLILCRPLLLLPSIFPIIRVFSNKPALCMRLPKYWSFSFSISPFNEHPRLISFRID